MGGSRHWLSAVRRTFIRSSCKTIAILDDVDNNNSSIITICSSSLVEDEGELRDDGQQLTGEELAAIKIQAHFRGHLARRAYRALRSLVRVQAVVRGVCVRRQARLASHCMQALVRLQVRVRARQLLESSGYGEL